MNQPRNAAEMQYVHRLAAHLIRAHDQAAAGDKRGSVTFTDAFRNLKAWGATRFPQENQGLVEWAEMLSRESPRNDRLVAFLDQQDQRIAQGDNAMIAPSSRAEHEYVKQLTTILETAAGLRKAGNTEMADTVAGRFAEWEARAQPLFTDRHAGLVAYARAHANEADAMAIITDADDYPTPDFALVPPAPGESAVERTPSGFVPPEPNLNTVIVPQSEKKADDETPKPEPEPVPKPKAKKSPAPKPAPKNAYTYQAKTSPASTGFQRVDAAAEQKKED